MDKRTEELVEIIQGVCISCMALEGKCINEHCRDCMDEIRRRIEGPVVSREQLKKLHEVMGQEEICSYLKSESGWNGYLPISEVELENMLREAGVKVEDEP